MVEIGIALDPGASAPLYQQVFDAIAQRIASETYPGGHRLPPTRVLAAELGTHRNTIVRAYEALESAGFVNSTVGRGTFVVPRGQRKMPAAELRGGAGPTLPWSSLVSTSSNVEPLGRLDRLRRAPSARVINLTGMQPPDEILPHELLRRCLDHVLTDRGAEALRYAEPAGLLRLREAVAVDLARRGVPVDPAHLLITSGSQQGLDVITRALVDPGDVMLMEEATYSGAITVMAAAGARLVPVPTDEHGPSIDALDNLSRDAKGFYVMPDHNNPTGRRMSTERRKAIVDWSHRTKTALIEDDYAADLELDPVADRVAMRALDGQVIHVGSYSKRLIPALRIGYVAAPPAFHARLLTLKRAMDLGSSALTQHALAEFLERGYLEPHVRMAAEHYRRRRDVFERALRRYLPEGYTWRRPASGMTLWLELPSDSNPVAVFEEAERHGVLVSPGSLNGIGRDLVQGVRLSFCSASPRQLKEGAKRLGRALEALRERRPSRSSDDPIAISAI